jgi:hypothetical protein
MRFLRIFIAATLLVCAPLAGAFAAALGVDATHHHCDDVWHGHADHVVSAQDDDHDARPNLDPSICDDCHIVLAALPFDTPPAMDVRAASFPPAVAAAAQARVAVALFRPPKS